MRPRILIIGSGAVGAVYARHLVKAGRQAAALLRAGGMPAVTLKDLE